MPWQVAGGDPWLTYDEADAFAQFTHDMSEQASKASKPARGGRLRRGRKGR